MGWVCEVSFETSFDGNFSIRVETGPDGAELRLAEFGKTRYRSRLTAERAAQLESAMREVGQLPFSEGERWDWFDGTRVTGVMVLEGHEEAWTLNHLQPGAAPHEYGMAWLLAEAAWETADERSQSILLRIRSEVGGDLPRIAVLERMVGDVLLARVLLPFSPEQRLSIELWVASLPEGTPLVVELHEWVERWATEFPLDCLAPLSLRPGTAFISPNATIPNALQQIVGRRCFPDFHAARRHALFGGQ